MRRVGVGIIANPKITGARYLWLESYEDGSQRTWPYLSIRVRGKRYQRASEREMDRNRRRLGNAQGSQA